MEPKSYVTRKEMAEILGCHVTHIGIMIREGRIDIHPIRISTKFCTNVSVYSRLMFMELIENGLTIKRPKIIVTTPAKKNVISFIDAHILLNRGLQC